MLAPYAMSPPSCTYSRAGKVAGSACFVISSTTPFALRKQHRTRKHKHRLRALGNDAGECAVDLVGVARRREMGLQAQRLRGLRHFRHQIADSGFAESAGMPEDADAGERGQPFLKQG